MEKNEYFTISFYPEKHRLALNVMGSISGRDSDKDKISGLTVKDIGKAVTYEEAETTILCKKIYFQDMVTDNMPSDVIDQYYAKEKPHRMYVGEVIEVIYK